MGIGNIPFITSSKKIFLIISAMIKIQEHFYKNIDVCKFNGREYSLGYCPGYCLPFYLKTVLVLFLIRQKKCNLAIS